MNEVAQAKHEIAMAVEDAKRVIANDAMNAVKINNAQQSGDHDLLIQISTQMQDLRVDVKDIRTNTVGRIENLEINKADKIEIDKVCIDITNLKIQKNWIIWAGSITFSVMVFLAIKLFEHLTTK